MGQTNKTKMKETKMETKRSKNNGGAKFWE